MISYINDPNIDDVLYITPEILTDSRGYFLELYKQDAYSSIGIKDTFIQENFSYSKRGVLRGLHYQIKNSQAKLVQCLKGRIYDVAVDLRYNSPTFGTYTSYILTGKDKNMLYIPKNFAHGFLVLSDSAELLYKVSDVYNPQYERTIIYNDPNLGIDWNNYTSNVILSDKDKLGNEFDPITLLL